MYSKRLANSLGISPFYNSTEQVLRYLRYWVPLAHQAPKRGIDWRQVDPTEARVVNEKKSSGNFFVDQHKNVVLDLNQAHQPLGYNSGALRRVPDYSAAKKDSELMRQIVLRNAPDGLNDVVFAKSSSGANEAALKASLDNQGNGAIIGFENSSHGESAENMINVRLPYPNLQYPYAQFEHENRAEEDRCLKAAEEAMNARKSAALIVEPIQDRDTQFATPYFFKNLRRLANKNRVIFVVDETNTGLGQTGRWWGLQHWNLDHMPEVVTFGRSELLSGFYARGDIRSRDPWAPLDFNEDIHKLAEFDKIQQEIEWCKYLEVVTNTGSFLKLELDRAFKMNGGYCSNIRGQGTFLGWDLVEVEKTDHIVNFLKRQNIEVKKTGETSIGLRPALILFPHHVAPLRESLMHYSPLYEQ